MLVLGVNGAIEMNQFLLSVNATIDTNVDVDAWCEYTLKFRSQWALSDSINDSRHH